MKSFTPCRSAPAATQLSILLPTYCEAGTIRPLLQQLDQVIRNAKLMADIWVMDDRSPDGTAAIARATRVETTVYVITRTGARGLSEAVLEGIRLSRGECILVMDADLQHPPTAIPRLFDAVSSGADMAIGSRYVSGGEAREFSLYRRLNSGTATLLCRPLVGGGVRDPLAGLFCVKRSTLEGAALSPTGYKIGLEILVRARPIRIIELPITFGSRAAGDSKMTRREQIKYLRHLARLYAHRFPVGLQAASFCLVGGFGMVLDLSMMAVLTGVGWGFFSARAVSILAAMHFNFVLNRAITFKRQASDRVVRQYGRFMLSCTLGAAISWSVSSGLFAGLPLLRPLYPLLCVAGIIAGTATNFLLSRYWAFAPGRRPG